MRDWHSADVELVRVALTPAQIDAYHLPEDFDAGKPEDPNRAAFLAAYPNRACVELDALHPRDLSAITQEALCGVYDLSEFDEQQRAEREERLRLKRIRREVATYCERAWPDLFAQEVA